jgi:hypothetical protein
MLCKFGQAYVCQTKKRKNVQIEIIRSKCHCCHFKKPKSFTNDQGFYFQPFDERKTILIVSEIVQNVFGC